MKGHSQPQSEASSQSMVLGAVSRGFLNPHEIFPLKFILFSTSRSNIH